MQLTCNSTWLVVGRQEVRLRQGFLLLHKYEHITIHALPGQRHGNSEAAGAF